MWRIDRTADYGAFQDAARGRIDLARSRHRPRLRGTSTLRAQAEYADRSSTSATPVARKGRLAGLRHAQPRPQRNRQYVRAREDLKDMTIGLFSRCQGSNATMFAMQRYPEQFEGVRCIVSPQPLSVGVTMQRTLEMLGLPERIAELEKKVRLIVSFPFSEMLPVEAAKSVTIPTFLYQVHDDLMTRPDDVQAMFDNIPAADKKLVWVHGTTARWDGYLHFQREPKEMLDWFATHMK
ncbi:alpha/beta hydrolase family protein [Streptomyces sp. NPDC001273]|uniref:alpha/beta hydrolase family protein n=1 Tax=unclassified Streptomyces TaxID=2593676 RepID=UPI0033E873FC